jgi:hypothetical protein
MRKDGRGGYARVPVSGGCVACAFDNSGEVIR